MKSLGRHLLVEYYNCDRTILNDVALVEKIVKDAAVAGGATIVQSVFHLFNPQGVSGVVVIAESHLAIHTWPEHGYAAADLFTCGEDVDPWKSHEFLKKELKAKESYTNELRRGLLTKDGGKMKIKPFEIRKAC